MSTTMFDEIADFHFQTRVWDSSFVFPP